jgi:hypothetical protein
VAVPDAERRRLAEDAARIRNWKRWGPYLAERQWGTVREDYSADGECWTYLPHDHARSRAYRWGEDGLLGFCDRECRLCFSLALWNGVDPILKERPFGLANGEGNHGEDVKEYYFYLDATPTHSYQRALYKYPQTAFPYERLVEENHRRDRTEPEFELLDTGIFDGQRYFDVLVEYAKATPDDLVIRITATNRGPDPAPLHLLPTLWFRNTWAWRDGVPRPSLVRRPDGAIAASHPTLGPFRLVVGPGPDGRRPEWLFTENETNDLRLFGGPNRTPWVKDAFHERIVGGRREAVNPDGRGTKAAAWVASEVPAGGTVGLRLRLFPETEAPPDPLGPGFDETLRLRIEEADAFHAASLPRTLSEEQRRVARQAYAGLLWSQQFYGYVVKEWLEGDPTQPPPPASRLEGRNHDWTHVHCQDVLSMPDKWEFPWFASWDHAFQMVALARVDGERAKQQLLLYLREWYMHPSGQVPAYEFAFSDVNPPVHAWACWRVYKTAAGPKGRDRAFLARAFHKLLINFTWWVNRKDEDDNNLFAGGFLGLDNIGLFDRSMAFPAGMSYAQADGTAWMAFYCLTLLAIALELAREEPVYEDVASKFFEHFVAIADAMNSFGGTGLWDDEDGFYYDVLRVDGRDERLRVRSMVGLISLVAVEVLADEDLARLPGFRKRMDWFLEHRPDLSRHIACCDARRSAAGGHRRLLAIPSRERLERVLRRLLDEEEFLSPHGIRSLSRFHREHPYVRRDGDRELTVDYEPGESRSALFGGNSNWRGPVWMPVNYLIIEALQRYHHFYGDSLRVEWPTGSGRSLDLAQVAAELAGRVVRLFVPDAGGARPCHGGDKRFAVDPHWRDLLLFHEYFHGDDGRGCGASHQTGWTALVAPLLQKFPPAARPGNGGASHGG